MVSFNEVIVNFVLCFFRISGIFFFSPFFSSNVISARLRVGFSFFVSLLLFNTVTSNLNLFSNVNFLILLFLSIKELLIGALIGFFVALIFSTVQTASQIYSMNLGLMMANSFDPLNQNQASVLGQLKNLFILALFFVYGVHRIIISAIISTFEYSPIGKINYDINSIASFFIENFAYYFLIAIQISLPIIGMLMLIDMTLGILSRIAPQMNVFFIGMPLKLLVGYYVLKQFAPYFVNFFIIIFEKLDVRLLEVVKRALE